MAVFYGRQIQPPAATPFPSSPKAVRAFVTTATSSLVNDRDNYFAPGTRCG
jgi:hypothetical protein